MSLSGTSDAVRRVHAGVGAELTESDRKRLRDILVSMLNDIQDVAEENNIEFELGGGSALGAVRHKGFIPWDDDIDINIRRSEWDRLYPALISRYKDKYDILLPGKDEGYVLLFPQVRLKGTVLKTRDDLHNDKCGVPVDIFLIENTYNNPVRRFIHMIGCQYYGFAVSCRKFRRDRFFLTELARASGNSKLISSTRTKIFWGSLLSFLSLKKLTARADRWNGKCKDDDSLYITVPAGRNHFRGELRKREEMFPPSAIEFEGRLRPCPASADTYLTQLYGDYKKIPAEEDRESHIYFEPLDLG